MKRKKLFSVVCNDASHSFDDNNLYQKLMKMNFNWVFAIFLHFLLLCHQFLFLYCCCYWIWIVCSILDFLFCSFVSVDYLSSSSSFGFNNRMKKTKKFQIQFNNQKNSQQQQQQRKQQKSKVFYFLWILWFRFFPFFHSLWLFFSFWFMCAKFIPEILSLYNPLLYILHLSCFLFFNQFGAHKISIFIKIHSFIQSTTTTTAKKSQNKTSMSDRLKTLIFFFWLLYWFYFSCSLFQHIFSTYNVLVNAKSTGHNSKEKQKTKQKNKHNRNQNKHLVENAYIFYVFFIVQEKKHSNFTVFSTATNAWWYSKRKFCCEYSVNFVCVCVCVLPFPTCNQNI